MSTTEEKPSLIKQFLLFLVAGGGGFLIRQVCTEVGGRWYYVARFLTRNQMHGIDDQPRWTWVLQTTVEFLPLVVLLFFTYFAIRRRLWSLPAGFLMGVLGSTLYTWVRFLQAMRDFD